METALSEAADDYRRSQAAFDAARHKLAQQIRKADAAKMRQVDILRATGHVWTREQVRRVCLPPANA